ncbi:MAG: hypothetical protein KDI83_00185 [Gammaproteobacteria bacterium]|nr:hypothetical protein [Gammaproteobacteria bacterium]MCP5418123.1 hypothetical protein [Chromatiaceae bacterium]
MHNSVSAAGAMLLLALALTAPQPGAQSGALQNDNHTPLAAAGQAHSHRRGAMKLLLENAEGAQINLWKPDLTRLPLTIEHGIVTLPATGVDNYHALVIERDWGYLHETLIRYLYLHGKPSGHSTSELTAAEKSSFEIVPDPVPREHQHYRSDQQWRFQVRFKGAPVAHLPVELLSSYGSRLSAVSDERGLVELRLPDDFPQIETGRRDRRGAEFTLSAELSKGGITYQTRLYAEYRVNPSHWHSLELGILAGGIGMLAGGLIGRLAVRSSR